MKLKKHEVTKQEVPNLDQGATNMDTTRRLLNEVMARVLAERGVDREHKRELAICYTHLETAGMYLMAAESNEPVLDLLKVYKLDDEATKKLHERLDNDH